MPLLLAYNANNRRSSSGYKDLTPADFTIEVGDLRTALGASGVTNTPCPNPESMDGLAGNQAYLARVNGIRYYRAKVDIPTPVGPVMLSNLAEQVRLVDKGLFEGLSANAAVIPAVVKISARERANAVAPQAGSGLPSGIVNSVACAQMGGPRLGATSGLLRIEFPQGMPPIGSPAPFTGNAVSPLSIMNASQVNSIAQGGSNAPWSGNGGYFTANGGAFPGSGSITRSNYMGRNADNPSVSLTLFVYDWLKNEGIKPNIESVVKSNAQPRYAQHSCRSKLLQSYLPVTNRPADMAAPVELVSSFLEQPAFAQRPPVGDSNNVYGAIFNLVDC
jgi:hypothetical protein